jgi:hypothetical protein
VAAPADSLAQFDILMVVAILKERATANLEASRARGKTRSPDCGARPFLSRPVTGYRDVGGWCEVE